MRIILLEWGSGVVSQALSVDSQEQVFGMRVFRVTQVWAFDQDRQVLFLTLDELKQIVQAAEEYSNE